MKRQQVTYSYKVLDLVSSRQPAKNVPDYCLNTTPQEELDKLNVPRETIFVFRDRGTGRPTKKERRDLDELMEGFITTTRSSVWPGRKYLLSLHRNRKEFCNPHRRVAIRPDKMTG